MNEAVRAMHFPPTEVEISIEDLNAAKTPYHQRLIFDEFFKFEYLILKKKLSQAKEKGPQFEVQQLKKDVLDLSFDLPFELTGDQKTVLSDILADFSSAHPMNRLVQGDVGSGKTAVALLAAGAVMAQGSQAVLMAPTEILAEQHFKNMIKIFAGKLSAVLLTGRTTASERRKILGRLQTGQPLLVIGTHAVIEDPVKFVRLDLVMIDEQHRFGVDQRKALWQKGVQGDVHPHQLVLTATPIPRTLALTVYGDLSVSAIKEMPPGRTPIRSKVVRSAAAREEMVDHIRKELQSGRQAYFIYPLVNESEAEGFTNLRSAVIESERLQNEVFPDFKVGLLHGQLSSDEKSKAMDSFKRGELHILVSTTVVEVGVDVPNSTIMVVDHAERFGLSQLHQLRGRVGRGSHQSYCYFLSRAQTTEVSEKRLSILEDTEDGFRIAEADLEIRGPGEFMGTRQSGDLPFKMANLVRDQKWLFLARDEAIRVLKEDPGLRKAEHQGLRSYLRREGARQVEILRTS